MPMIDGIRSTQTGPIARVENADKFSIDVLRVPAYSPEAAVDEPFVVLLVVLRSSPPCLLVICNCRGPEPYISE